MPFQVLKAGTVSGTQKSAAPSFLVNRVYPLLGNHLSDPDLQFQDFNPVFNYRPQNYAFHFTYAVISCGNFTSVNYTQTPGTLNPVIMIE